MKEFGDMLREALVGEEPYQPDPGREALERSVRKFEARAKTVRFLTWFTVTLATIVFVVGLVLLLRADESTSGRSLALYAVLTVGGFSLVGVSKMWFMGIMQNHIQVMRELKVTQMSVLELREHVER
jgi:hypothetical protein